MAYTLEEIKELVETLTPIIKNAIEAGSLSGEHGFRKLFAGLGGERS